MADDGSEDDGRDDFYYVLSNVIQGNHLPCPRSVEPLLPELPQVWPPSVHLKHLHTLSCVHTSVYAILQETTLSILRLLGRV